MANEGKRIFQYPEVTTLTDDDYALIDNRTGGPKSIKAKKLAPSLMSKTITERGVYKASDDGVRGYNEVNVNIPYTDIHVATGAIATFEGEDLPLKSLTASIVPVQDLHGYDSPWAGGAGKNKLPMTVDGIKSANTSGTWSRNSYVINGVTFTIQTDSDGNVIGIKANGLASADAKLEVGAYTSEGLTISGNGCPSNGSTSTYYLEFTYMGRDTGAGRSNQTIASGNLVIATVTIKSGYNASNLVFYPMIRLASASNTFEPYSNICPISGWTEEVITVTDDLQNPTVTHTTTIPFTDGQGQSVEVFGGSVDVVNGGEQPKTLGYVDLGDLNWAKYGDDYFYTSISDIKMPKTSADRNKGMMCSDYKPSPDLSVAEMADSSYLKFNQAESFWLRDSRYTSASASDFKQAVSGVQLVYELATPTTFYTNPTSIKSLDGVNNMFASTGDVDVEYQTVWVRPTE